MGPEPSDFEVRKIRCANCSEMADDDNEDCPECGEFLQEALCVTIEFFCKDTSDMLGLADSIHASAGCFYIDKEVLFIDVPREISKEDPLYPVYEHLGDSGRGDDMCTLMGFAEKYPENVEAFLNLWQKKGTQDVNEIIRRLAQSRVFGKFSFEKLPSHGGGFVIIVRALGIDPLAFADTDGLYFWAGRNLDEKEHSELMEWCEGE